MTMLANVRAILFDAVGTLIYPDPPVAVAYHRAASRLGSKVAADEIALRFRDAIKKHHQLASVDPRTSDESERLRWKGIVYEVIDDVDDPEGRLLAELWDHFGQPASWRLFDDVLPAWDELTRRGYLLGIASNFDSRLRTICRGLPPLDRCEHIFVSSEVGYPKPAPQFYQRVQQQLGLPAESIVLVGDDYESDVTAPSALGWKAIWLRRDVLGPITDGIVTLGELTGLVGEGP